MEGQEIFPTWHRGRTDNGGLLFVQKWGIRWTFPPHAFSFDYKTIAHQVLRTTSSCLPACKLHKHSTLTNPFLSIALLLAKLFLHWKIKTHSSSEAFSPPPPMHFCGFTLGDSEFSRPASENVGQERGVVGQGYAPTPNPLSHVSALLFC